MTKDPLNENHVDIDTSATMLNLQAFEATKMDAYFFKLRIIVEMLKTLF